MMDADGSGDTLLNTHNYCFLDGDLAWSPAGGDIVRIVFVLDDGDDIYAMDPDESKYINLTKNPSSEDQAPVWSPGVVPPILAHPPHTPTPVPTRPRPAATEAPAATPTAVPRTPVPTVTATLWRAHTVTKADDTNDGVCDADCSLREAIAAASSGDEIIIPAGIYTLTLGLELIIDKSLTLTGTESGGTIIQAAVSLVDATSLVLYITSSAENVTISNVTIRHGRSDCGGGMLTESGSTTTLMNSTISQNEADTCGGGAMSSRGAVTLVNSTISGNNALFWGGAIRNQGALTLINSTISGNVGGTEGGIIYNESRGTLTVSHSTITGNMLPADARDGTIHGGGGITVVSSIIGNESSRNCSTSRPYLPFSTTSLGHNLDSDGTCGLTASVDISNIDPLLGPLQDNGGPTFTRALLPGSPAIDAGSCTDADGNPVATDQRGIIRPQGTACDIGAYELVQ